MGLTTSLYTGLSGLTANSQAISVAGNNIANVNTTAFKSSRADFQTQISQNLSLGSAPSATSGGSNPKQIGLGTAVAAITRNFNGGAVQPTGVATEMAVEGDGFFVVNLNGTTRYTRDGSFRLNSDYNLTSSAGGLVQGYGIDDSFNIIPGAISNLSIPLGNLTIAERTQNVRFAGNLNSAGEVAANGSVITSNVLYADAGATTPATAATALTSLYNASGGQLFATGDLLTMSGATRGTASLPETTFQVGATNTTGSDANGATVQDMLDFLRDVMGVDTSIVGGSAGVDIVNGAIVVTGNTGLANDLELGDGNLIKNQSTAPTLPFNFTKSVSADGESVRTTFVAYDSLGGTMNLDMSLVLESKSNTGTVWRFYAQSDADTDLSRVLGNGTLTFDTNGQLTGVTGNTINIDRAGTGAFSPQQINLRFDQPAGAISALAATTSQLSSTGRDGTPVGTLESFSINDDGTIVGVFSNSQLRTLGQVVLAKFANSAGLVDTGNNMFNVSGASGGAALVTPGTAGSGRVVGGALELSNVDLSQEFINLITASTGFSANSRVLSTSDRLIQELLATLR